MLTFHHTLQLWTLVTFSLFVGFFASTSLFSSRKQSFGGDPGVRSLWSSGFPILKMMLTQTQGRWRGERLRSISLHRRTSQWRTTRERGIWREGREIEVSLETRNDKADDRWAVENKTFNFSMPVRPSISAGLVVFLCYIFVNNTFPRRLFIIQSRNSERPWFNELLSNYCLLIRDF